MKDGVIANFEVAEKMLRHFLAVLDRRILRVKPTVIVCVPSGSPRSSAGPCATPPSRRE